MTAPSPVHASCVDLDGQGVLITGASGRGKSTLALALIGQGARLVADDRVALVRTGETVTATRPPGLPPLIEARGLGLLHAPLCSATVLALVVDLDTPETERLPPLRHTSVLGCAIPLIYRGEGLDFGFHLALMLRHGRGAP